MTAVPEAAWLRGELENLLQESDPDRPLDSLETVVVLTYLRNHALAPAELTEGFTGGFAGGFAEGFAAEHPGTIEGWLSWVEKHSPGS